ncbi:MAG: hypothetical protein RhofKO_36780 [Rhodothermales bacterium]
MKTNMFIITLIGVLTVGCADHHAGQHNGSHADHTLSAATQPYAGQHVRAVKALAPERMAGLAAGAGLGYAKAAELNSYPGPKHVLELAEALDLSAEQVAQTEALRAEMLAQAMPLGNQLIAHEATLDSLFASSSATPEQVQQVARQIGRAEADLRAVHLNAHVGQRAVLSAEQVAKYDELRGYTGNAEAHDHSAMSH